MVKFMISQIKKSLAELGFDAKETKVYLALTELGEAPASKVAKKADLQRTTAISILNKLAEDNYLSTHRYKGLTYYWIESPKVIQEVLSSKLALAEQLESSLTDLYRTEANFPFAHVYDTKKGIKSFIEKFLSKLDKKSVIYTIDSPHLGNYRKLYSDALHNAMVEIKRKKDITTNTLIPYGTFGKIEAHKLKQQDINIREMPRGIDFSASIWLTKDFLVLFSGQPPFIVSVHHRLIVASHKSIFDYLWLISEEKN